MKRDLLFILLITILCVFLLKALFHPGIYTAHDIWHNLARLYYYKTAIIDGQFPPYWIGTLLNHWGYPLFFFSYHLPWLTALPFLGMGISIPDTIKLLFFISFLLSGYTMYLFANSLFKNPVAAFLVSFLYLLAPYRLVIIFVSAATGISFVFVFLPLLLYGINLAANKSRYATLILSIGLAGIILSHLTSLFVLTPVIFIFLLATFLRVPAHERGPLFVKLLVGFFLGLVLSGFYLLPALFYGKTVEGLPSIWKTGFVSLKQLFYSKWGYGIINRSAEIESPFSFQIGIAQWLVVFTSILSVLVIKGSKKVRLDIALMLFAFTISVFFTLKYSSVFWSPLSKLTNIDFPFRFIMPAFIVASILAGYLYNLIPKKFKLIFLLGLISIGLYTNRNNLRVNMYIYEPVSTFINSETTTNSYSEYIPNWASSNVVGSKINNVVNDANIKTSNIYQNTKQLTFDFVNPKEVSSSINYLYYPGLKVYIDGKEIKTGIDKAGRLTLLFPTGNHHLEVIFKGNTPIIIGKIITYFGVFMLIFLLSHPLRTRQYAL